MFATNFTTDLLIPTEITEIFINFVGNDSGITEFMMESIGFNHKEHIEHKKEGGLKDPLCDLCVLCGFYLPSEGKMLTARNSAICAATSAPPRFDDVVNV